MRLGGSELDAAAELTRDLREIRLRDSAVIPALAATAHPVRPREKALATGRVVGHQVRERVGAELLAVERRRG